MKRRPARAAAWLLALLAAASLLRLAGTGELASPPLASLDGLTGWVEARAPAAAGIALVRLLAELTAWYALGLSALHAAAHGLRWAGGHRLADALAMPGLRRTVRAGLGLGLVAASSVGGRAPDVPVRSTATMSAPVDAGTATMEPLRHRTGTASMRPVPQPAGTAAMRPTAGAPARPSPAVRAVATAPPTWTVAAGESLWSIAEDVLADAWGRPPSDAEVDPFWRALVEANRHRLLDADEPDVIHPGQVLEVPVVPARPAA